MNRIAFGALFLSAAALCYALGTALLYETYAIVTEKVPTISAITAGQVHNHAPIAIVYLVVACVLVGALAAHFFWAP